MNARKRPEPEMSLAEIEHTLNTALTYDCICPRDLNTSGSGTEPGQDRREREACSEHSESPNGITPA
jgi:hypothetical protein